MVSDSQNDWNILLHSQKVVEAARGRLRQSLYPAVRGVTCECQRGVLLLRGQLSSYYHKQLAQEAVARLEGVMQVVNEIEVIASFP